jgi:hypothetical protein
VLAAEPLAATVAVPAVKPLCDSGADLLRNPLQICTRITMKCEFFTSRVGRQKLV